MPISRLLRSTTLPYEEESIYDDASYKPEENTFVEPVAGVVNEASEGE